MADEDLLPIDDDKTKWQQVLGPLLQQRPQMDSRTMQAAPVAPSPPALNVNPTGTPTAPPDSALRIPGNDGLKSNDSTPTPSLTGGLKAPDVKPDMSAALGGGLKDSAQPSSTTWSGQMPAQDLEPHGWRKALGLGLLALTGKEAGANADEFLHGGERRAAEAAKQASEQQLQEANIRHLNAETANIGLDKPGKTMDEQAFASLIKQGKTPLEAYTAIKQAGQDVKPDRVKTPEEQALDFLQTTVNPATKKNYTLGEAYEKIKSEGKAPSENEEERNIQSYLTTNKLPDNAANRAKALTYFTQAKQDPGIAAANARQNKTEDFQESEAGRKELDKHETAYTDAQEKASNLRQAVQLAQGGNMEAAALQNLMATLGIVTMEGIKRINTTELNSVAGAGDLFTRIQGQAGKLVAGQPVPANLQRDITQLADMLEKSAYNKYKSNFGRTVQRYNLKNEQPVPGPGAGNGEKPVYQGSKLIGYTTDGKTISRTP